MTITPQYNKHSCFVACLESFFRDNGRNLDQQLLVTSRPDLFNGGATIEGSCNVEDFSEVAAHLNLGFSQVGLSFSFQFPSETIIFFLHWNNSPNDAHCVRFVGHAGNEIKVMNPMKHDDYDKIPHDWIRGIYKFSL